MQFSNAMKNLNIIIALLGIMSPVFSQQIGFGTSNPTYPLTFPSLLGDKISLWGGDFAPNADHYGFGVQTALFQIFTPPGGDFAFGNGRSAAFNEVARITGVGEFQSKGAAAGYTFFDRLNLADITKRFVWYNSTGTARLFSGTFGDVMSIKHNGFIGIGVADPLAKLHVNGAMRIVDGTQSDGKVLTSDASGNTSWQAPALANADRFLLMFDFSGSSQPSQWLQGYETSLDISLSTVSGLVTINKSGLYHFEVCSNVSTVVSTDITQFSATPELFWSEIVVNSVNNSIDYEFVVFKVPFLREISTAQMRATGRGTFDIYLEAPATVKIQFDATTSTRTYNAGQFGDNYISGYLISE